MLPVYLLGCTITAPSRWVWGRRSARYPYIRATAKFIITRPYLFHVYRVVSFSYRPVPPTANRETLLVQKCRTWYIFVSIVRDRENIYNQIVPFLNFLPDNLAIARNYETSFNDTSSVEESSSSRPRRFVSIRFVSVIDVYRSNVGSQFDRDKNGGTKVEGNYAKGNRWFRFTRSVIEPLKTRAILFANRGAHHLQKHKHPSPSIPAPSLRDEIEKYTDVTVTLADLHPHRLGTNYEQVVFIVKTPRPLLRVRS